MDSNGRATGRARIRRAATKAVVLALLGVAFWLGYLMRGSLLEPPAASDAAPARGQTAPVAAAQVWTCSMHPQIHKPQPGSCPICGMDLIPVSAGGEGDAPGPRAFATSEAAKELMRIETALVERRFVTAEIRMVGKVDYDETRLGHITAWVPGRIERMFVDYTGISVRKGDHMVELYSPELLNAQQELRRTAQALAKLSATSPGVLRESAEATLEAVRSKLRRWGMTEGQVQQAEQQGALSDRITIYAPMGGTVIERSGKEGMYVTTGERIYTIADLGVVWVMLDAYESDLPWIHYGQPVEFTTEALPGEVFEGKIAFVDPILDARTRTVKVRVNVPNREGKLKPGMFVRGVVRSKVATGGRVMDPGLAGKWISPMHPEVVKDGPGTCDVCGMPLVRAEELGYVAAEISEDDKPLVIPTSAPLITGKRAVVYVEAPEAERPTYEGREVVLGPRAGDFYLVESGLEEGERVVTHGNFKIDSALQILAKPSMMSPEGGSHMHGGSATKAPAPRQLVAPKEFQAQLRHLYEAYLGVPASLAGDRFEAASKAVNATLEALGAVDMKPLEGEAHMGWMSSLTGLNQALEKMRKAKDIDAMRVGLEPLSNELLQAIKTFGIAPGDPVYQLHCPMSFEGRGAEWLQADKQVRNPYYGAAMLSCGSVVGRIDGPE